MIFTFVIERNTCLPNQLFLSGAQSKQVPLPIYAFFFIYLFIYFFYSFFKYKPLFWYFRYRECVSIFSLILYFLFRSTYYLQLRIFWPPYLITNSDQPPLSSLNLMSSGLISCSINYLATLNISLFWPPLPLITFGNSW